MLKLYVAVDVSDDDVTLADVAEQCGYDVRHPQVIDVSAPVVAHFHERDCLMFVLELAAPVSSPDRLLGEAEVLLSHPSVSSFTILA